MGLKSRGDGPRVLETACVCRGRRRFFFLFGSRSSASLPRAEIAASGPKPRGRLGHGTGSPPRPLLSETECTPRHTRTTWTSGKASIEKATGIQAPLDLNRPPLKRPLSGFSPGLLAVRRLGLSPLLWSRWGQRLASCWRSPDAIFSDEWGTEDLGRGTVSALSSTDADHYSESGLVRATVAGAALGGPGCWRRSGKPALIWPGSRRRKLAFFLRGARRGAYGRMIGRRRTGVRLNG